MFQVRLNCERKNIGKHGEVVAVRKGVMCFGVNPNSPTLAMSYRKMHDFWKGDSVQITTSKRKTDIIFIFWLIVKLGEFGVFL